MQALDTKERLLLVRLLGELHALMLPLRDCRAPYWAQAWVWRWEYAVKGLPWRGGGDKQVERTLNRLCERGLVRRYRSTRKTLGVGLPHEGILVAGECVWFTRDEAEIFAAELLRHAKPGHWVPEIALNDGQGWGDGKSNTLTIIDDTALQALSLGYAESNCTVRGHVYYRTTPRGEAAVEAWDGEPLPEIDYDPEMVKAYGIALSEALAKLRAAPQLPREIGQIPLPVSMGRL